MTALVAIGGGHQLAPAPAAAYLRARAAGCPAGITSSYRDPVRQAAMRAQYEVDLAAWRAGHIPTKPSFVARVEDSEHVDGYALDLPVAPRAWMRAHPEYGFVFTDPSEAWHVAYRLIRDRHTADVVPLTPPAPAKEEDMSRRIVFARLKTDPKVYRGDCLTRTWVPSQAAIADIESMIRVGVLEEDAFEPLVNGKVQIHYVDSLDWLGQEVRA